MTQPSIKNVKVETLEYDLSKFAEVKEKILSLLPTRRDERISFEIYDASAAIANGIRRVVGGELLAKCMRFELTDIETTEEYIIPDELLDRISHIPMDQTVDIDAEFTIDVQNQDPKVEYMIVHSGDIKQIKGKKVKIPETFRLAELQPSRYLKIPKIKISSGYGWQHSGYKTTCDIIYQFIDYPIVTLVNQKGKLVNGHVHVDELMAHMLKFKLITSKSERSNLWRKKIAVIPNKSYQNMITPIDMKTIKRMNYIVQNPEDLPVDCPTGDNSFIKVWSSTEANPKDFYLSFRTHGNIDPKLMIREACKNIIERMNIVNDLIKRYLADGDLSGIVHITVDNIKTQIQIKNEDHTIGQLLIKTIYELDSSASVTKTLEHPSNRTVIINIKHPEPLKLTMDAIDLCCKRYTDISETFK
jgi:DNA-directed RNA polymerase subunit L